MAEEIPLILSIKNTTANTCINKDILFLYCIGYKLFEL